MIDFGDWATEANRVAGESLEDNVWSADLEKYDDTDFKLQRSQIAALLKLACLLQGKKDP